MRRAPQRKAFLLRFLSTALVLTALALLATPGRGPAFGDAAKRHDVTWGVSNPGVRMAVVRALTGSTGSSSSTPPAPPGAAPSSSPVATPSGSPTDTASGIPSGTPSDSPSGPGDTGSAGPSDPAGSSTSTSGSSSATSTTAAPSSTAPTSSPSTAPTSSPSSSESTIGPNLAMPTTDLPGWKLVFADDFSGTSLNRNMWASYGDNPIPSEPDSGFWANSHAVVGDGMLTLRGYRDAAKSPDGRIVTAGVKLWGLSQTYGKYEMAVRIDACPQVKYAFLLWPQSGRWPQDGEIDFAEDGGGDRSTTTGSVIYDNGTSTRGLLPQVRTNPLLTLQAWHVVGVEWTPGKVVFTIDGLPWGTVTSSHVPTGPMNFVAQTESVTMADQVPASFTSCDAQIGWVAQWAMN